MIKIKPSKVGSLHKHLGIDENKKIPLSKLKIKDSDSPSIKKKKQFALNARKFNHELGGYIESEINIARDGFNFENYFPMERDIPMDTISSYNRDIDKFAWRNTLQGDYNLKQLQSQQQLPQQIDSSYFLQKTPKGYSNVYDKSNRLIGYSMDNKTIVKQEPNFEDGGIVQAWIQKFQEGGKLYAQSGLNPYFGKFKNTYNKLGNGYQNSLTSQNFNNMPEGYPGIDMSKTTQYGQGQGGIGIDFNNVNNGQQGGVGITDVNLKNGNAQQEVGIKGTGIGGSGGKLSNMSDKMTPILGSIGAAGDAVIQGGSAIASMVGDESAGRALQKAGSIGKVAESFGNIVPIPGVGKALGAVASIFAAPFTAWGEAIATEEKNKGEKDAEFKMRNNGIITSNNPYGQYMAKYGSNPKMLEQRVIDDIYSDFDKYMKLT